MYEFTGGVHIPHGGGEGDAPSFASCLGAPCNLRIGFLAFQAQVLGGEKEGLRIPSPTSSSSGLSCFFRPDKSGLTLWCTGQALGKATFLSPFPYSCLWAEQVSCKGPVVPQC